MYENFGNTSLGGLPAGYGEASTEGVVGATEGLPSPQQGSGHYGGKVAAWWAERKASRGEPSSPEEAAARGAAVGAGAAGFVKETLPTFLEMFGPQVEEQPVVLPEDVTTTIPATFAPPKAFPWLPIIGISAAFLLVGSYAHKKWGK